MAYNPPPESANLAANESASESAARFTRLGGREQNFGGWHNIRPMMRRWLCRYHSSLHGTPHISAAPKILVFGNFAEFCRLVGPLTDSGGGGGLAQGLWWLALLACGGAYWPVALEPSAMTSRPPYYCGHPHCYGHPPAPGWESRMHLLPMAGGGGGVVGPVFVLMADRFLSSILMKLDPPCVCTLHPRTQGKWVDTTGKQCRSTHTEYRGGGGNSVRGKI